MKDKGPEWGNTEIIETFKTGDPRCKCVHCNKEFRGGASRIRAHLLGTKGVGVAACTACPQEVTDQFTALESAKMEESAKKRKVETLDSLTAQRPFAAEQQATIPEQRARIPWQQSEDGSEPESDDDGQE